jgi:isochorismate synthase
LEKEIKRSFSLNLYLKLLKNDRFYKIKTTNGTESAVCNLKPNKNKLIGLFQKNDHLYFVKTLPKLVVFAPLKATILIPKSESVKWEAELSSVEEKHFQVSSSENNDAQAHFEMLVQRIDAISNGLFHKVVLSRKEIVDVPDFDLVTVFTN